MKAIMRGERWEMEKAAELLQLVSGSRFLVMCGVAAAVVYVAANVVVPMLDPNYHWVSQTVSELSAIGAPTRDAWVWMMLPFGVLLMAFGAGVWKMSLDRTTTPPAEAAGSTPKQGGEPGRISDFGMRNAEFNSEASFNKAVNRNLRVVGALLFVQGLLGYFWPPMHMRGAEMTLTDTLHIALTFVVVPIMMLSIWFSGDVVGRTFAYVSIILVFGFGLLTGLDGPNIAANLPTPYVGLWERISIAAWVAWLAVLSARLLRKG